MSDITLYEAMEYIDRYLTEVESNAEKVLKDFKRANINSERDAITKKMNTWDDEIKSSAKVAGAGALSLVAVSAKIKKLENRLDKMKEENAPKDEIDNIQKRINRFKKLRKVLGVGTGVVGADAAYSYANISQYKKKLNDLNQREKELNET